MAIIAVIRIKGRFSKSPAVRGTLESLKLSTLYSCVLIPQNESYRGMLQSCKDVTSFGPVEKESVQLLLTKRGRTADGRRLSDAKKPEEIVKIAQELVAGKTPTELGIRAFFSLAPPKGGFGSRRSQAPFGPLGKNAAIGKLISLMA